MQKENGISKMWDIAVIGGGPAGLAAAATAARAGASVIVLEKAAALGGRSATLRQGGAAMNLGPHALYRGGAAQALLAELGIHTPGGSPTSHIHWVPDASRGDPFSTAGLLLGRALTWPEKRRFLRFFLRLRKTDAALAAGMSWKDWMARNGLTGRAADVGAAMGRLSTYVGDAARVDAGVVIRQLQKPGVIYPDGGWQTIVDALAACGSAAGMAYRTSANVTGMEREPGYWSIRLTATEPVTARQIIAAVDPARTANWFEKYLPPSYLSALRKLEPVFASVMDLHLRKLPRPNRPFALGLDEPLYFSAHSVWARLCDEPEHAVVHAMRYDGVQKGDAAAAKASLEAFLDRLQPGWRNEALRERFMPHIAVMYGLPSPELQGTAGRPAVETGAPGVYVAGDWAGTEGMLLDAAMASAGAAARSALRHLSIGVSV